MITLIRNQTALPYRPIGVQYDPSRTHHPVPDAMYQSRLSRTPDQKSPASSEPNSAWRLFFQCQTCIRYAQSPTRSCEKVTPSR